MAETGNGGEPWEWHYKLIRQLYEKADRNEEGIKAGNEALEQATAAFRAQVDAMPAEVAADVGRKLSASIAEAERKFEAAADAAGDRIVQKLTDANLKAERAAAAYDRAIKVSVWWIVGVAFACFLAGVAGVVLAIQLILPDVQELATMRLEQARLTEGVQILVRRGGQAEVIECRVGNTTRPCIRTDETVARGAFTRNNETFRLIYKP